ncbi:hypothetical protein MKEN_00595700 [Mycena kentingensis (nom. inval.)]|nr:hypothetical protein MKEN_00595700 [Mycena kentingensis (nom. inval.)]
MAATAAFGALALAASVNAAHTGFTRTHRHARVAAHKRADEVSGVAYYGYQNATMNACGTYSVDTDMVIGVGPMYYGDLDAVSDKCFQHITVTLASDSSKSVDVTLTDACKDCNGDGNVYLSPAAFTALSGGDLDVGVLDITWSFGSSGSGSSSSSSSGTGSSAVKLTDTSSDEKSDDSSSADAPTTTKKAETTTKKTDTKTSPTTTSKKSSSTGTSSDGWKLSKKLEGETFLDFFKYDTGTGDNSGVAKYVNGISSGLAYVSGDQVHLAVDTEQYADTRESLRMVSKTTFNADDNTLFIFDIEHMPAVCGAWPAVWFTGDNWPYKGEIDVVEGVSLYNKNIYSVHTGDGCTLTDSLISSMSKVKIIESTKSCNAIDSPGACGFTDETDTTFGPGFNKAGGGVFAMQFDTSAIQMWFFQAGSVPSDISSFAPEPSSWGTPKFKVGGSSCSTKDNFKDLMLIIDTNLAGSFTEGVWAVDGAGGQSTSCKSKTGFDSAAAYVQQNGDKFGDDALWKMNGFYIYNQN